MSFLARTRASRPAGLLLLLVILLVTIAVSTAIGAARLPFRTVLDVLMGGGEANERAIVLDLRLPRTMLAVIAGGSLALSGVVFQALLRNALAEPYVLGVSGGAAVGAVAAIVLGLQSVSGAFVPVSAFAGALFAILLVLRMAIGVGSMLDSRVLLLAGVIAGAFFNAVILLLLSLADVESFRSAIFWMMGDLSKGSWPIVTLLLAYSIPAFLIVMAMARALNLLAAGEETAAHLGIRVTRVKTIAYLVASLLVAATVAYCGVIGFVALVVPHALRLVWGGEHRFLLPASFLAGGAFLLIADTAARTVAAPAELPVGVLTVLIGVPVFVVLLRRSIP